MNDMEEKEKMIKVNCSFCNKEIESPESMMNSEKHSCWECFDKIKDELPHDEIHRMHVDIPRDKADKMMCDMLTENLEDEEFSLFWKKEKEILKDMPRRDAVFHAFSHGAKSMFYLMINTEKEAEEHEKEFAEKSKTK